MARIRDEILTPLTALGRTYVIGGLIRDLAMYGLDERPDSDLDLVVRCTPARLRRFAAICGGAENRFGGFAVRTEAYRIDFWSFSNTWAKTAGHVSLSTPADLTKTTFFDWDAVVYGLTENKLWAIDGYLDRLNSGLLDVNLMENPSRLGTLVRALRRLMMWDAKPSLSLRNYLFAELECFDWHDILAAERGAFHTRYLDEFASSKQYVRAVFDRSSFENRAFDRLRQAKFTEIESAPRVYEPIKTYGNLKISRARLKQPRRTAKRNGDLFAKVR